MTTFRPTTPIAPALLAFALLPDEFSQVPSSSFLSSNQPPSVREHVHRNPTQCALQPVPGEGNPRQAGAEHGHPGARPVEVTPVALVPHPPLQTTLLRPRRHAEGGHCPTGRRPQQPLLRHPLPQRDGLLPPGLRQPDTPADGSPGPALDRERVRGEPSLYGGQ